MFKLISHTADVALEVEAEGLDALFREAAMGWKHLILENAQTRSLDTRHIELSSGTPEDLIVQWLSELNFFLTTYHWVMDSIREFSLESKDSEWRLTAEISGEELDTERHYVYFDIKGVTYHQLKIEKANGNYKTRIIFDI